MIKMSDILINYPLQLVSGIIVFIVLFTLLYKHNKPAITNFFYSMPLVSKLVRQIDLTRFTRSLYLLLNSGLPISNALELTSEVVIKKQTHDMIKKTRDMVMSGKKFTEGLRLYKGMIPSMAIKLSEAGEKTGTLDNSMLQISEYLDYQVSNSLKALTALMEPIMLLVVGLCVGGMVMSIISPMYGLIGQVGGR
jgi:type II secretory pathway component PulF